MSARLFGPDDEPDDRVIGNKFHAGAPDGKHYWLTPDDLMAALQRKYGFDFDACPFPKPDDFDGLTCEWGLSTFCNPPFGSIIHDGKKKGPTAWARKAITEAAKGKRVVMVYPIDKWVLMLLAAGAEVRNLGDVRWCATEDGTAGYGTGRHIACFVLDGVKCHATDRMSDERLAELSNGALLAKSQREWEAQHHELLAALRYERAL